MAAASWIKEVGGRRQEVDAMIQQTANMKFST